SRRFEKGADTAWRVAAAGSVRRDRRSLTACLSPAMVLDRECREHRARLVAGLSTTWCAALGPERQRCRDDRGGDQRRSPPAGHPASNDTALFAVYERQDRDAVGSGGGPAAGHAGGGGRSQLAVSQRGDAGLGGIRIQSQNPLRDR